MFAVHHQPVEQNWNVVCNSVSLILYTSDWYQYNLKTYVVLKPAKLKFSFITATVH